MRLEAAPNWREINRNPRWLQWLQEIDSLSGRTRQQLLNDATAAGDAPRVIAFFRGFQQEVGQAPGRARPARPEKPIYTRAQIAQLYSAHRKGAYVGREAEWARQDADIIDFRRDEGRALPADLDYAAVIGLSNEVRQKLERIRPTTLGQAARIEGITAAAVTLILARVKAAKGKHAVRA